MGFCGELRANTAVDVLIGPFVDSTDGYTAETGLAIDVELSKLGQPLANKSDVTVPVHDDAGDIDGYYNCELDTTDTNTEGTLTLVCYAAGALPVRHDFMVLSEAAWDSKYIAKDDGFMDVNIKTIGRADTTETEASNLEAACAAYSVTRGLTGTALPAAVADAAGGIPISDAGGLDLDAIKAMTDKIGTVVNTGGTATLGAVLGDFANTALATRLSTTRATYLDYLFSIYFGLVSVVAQAQTGAAATITLAAGASAVNDFYKGQVITVYTGTGAGQARVITAYDGVTKIATISPNWATAPDLTSWYIITSFGSAILPTAVTNSITAIEADTNELQTDWVNGGRLDLILDAVKTDSAAIVLDTAEIGAAGAGLTAVPWNAAWDAEVESEVNDALNACSIADADVITANTIRETLRFLKWFVRNQRKVDKTTAPDTLVIFKDDDATAGLTHDLTDGVNESTREKGV